MREACCLDRGVGGSDKAAVVVFCGPGDHLASVPLGERYAVSSATANKNGVQTQLLRRVPLMDGTTYNGRPNAATFRPSHYWC